MSDPDEDVDKRGKVVETLWLFWGMSLTGLINGITGPTVLDLISLTLTNTSCMQFVFMSQGVGFVLAIPLTSLMVSYCRSSLLLSSSLAASVIINASIPWCKSFLVLEVATFLQGLSKGVLDFMVIYRCTQLWPRAHGFPLQFVATGVATGAVLAPFICEPFLADVTLSASQPTHSIESLSACVTNIANTTTTSDIYSTTQVVYSYSIVAAITIPPTIAFLYYYITQKRNRDYQWRYVSVPDSQNPLQEANRAETIKRRMLLVLILLFHIPFAGFYLTYSDLLAPFGVTSRLHVSSRRMATMTAIFWLMFLIGRIATTMFSRYLSQFVLLLMNTAGVVASAIFLVFTCEKQEVYLWLGTCALSFFNAPFLPGALSWLGEYISLDKSMITLTFIGAGLGELFLPFIAGHMFASVGPSSFAYCIVIIVASQTVIFIAMFVVKRFVHPIPTTM